MKICRPGIKTAVAAAVMLAVLPSSSVFAQNASKDNTLNLDEIIVTGTAEGGSKMQKSVAVSTLDGEQIANNQPQNAADVLSSIPGIHVESSGGAGNLNATVRGIPISAGGARYLNFQEDGLPVLLFGDIAFSTPDTFLRFDTTIDRVEAVRGGTGSTLTTNGPGGIVNFITKTGQEDGGSMGVTTGVGFNELRYDMNYGGHISNDTRFFIGGYIDQGQGPRNDTATAFSGGQVKGNITKELDKGDYLRLNFKLMSDQQPLYMPTPVSIQNGQISTIAGFDPRKYTGYSAFAVPDSVLTANNTHNSVNMNNGQVANSNAIGLEGKFTLANGWTLNEKFRTAANNGNWSGWFPGSTISNAPNGTTFVTGPNAGQGYTGPAFGNYAFDVSLNNMNSTTNDIKVSKTFANADGTKVTSTFGLFNNLQNVDLTWSFNEYLTQATGNNPAVLSNSSTTANGQIINPNFGTGCCSRAINAQYLTTSPYGMLTYETGKWTVDGSVRLDHQTATGSYLGATPPSNSSVIGTTFNTQNTQAINYSVQHTDYSFGVNYLQDKNLAYFARYSDGVSFNADRIMFASPLNGAGPIPLNEVNQFEAGIKAKSGNLSSFITFFDVKTKESNYDATTLQSTAYTYKSRGLEIEEGYRMGHFRLNAGGVYTSAKISDSAIPSNMIGATPNRLAKFVYQVGPSYSGADYTVGVNVVGTTSSLDAQSSPGVGVNLPAYHIVNFYANYSVDQKTTLSLGVYNLTNQLAYTEADNGYAARSLNGRTARLTLRYAL
jgi:outer membrane receptor protein involved in Fe transport